MEEAEAQRQIKQMVNFILNEAKDKAEEIEAKALEDFNIEKLKLVQQMKEKIRQDMSRKAKALETQRAIARSKAINEARLKKMVLRNEMLQKIGEECSQSIKKLLNNQAEASKIYANLLTEAALILLEEELEVRCKKSEVALVEGCYQAASAAYSKAIQTQTGVNKKCRFVTNKNAYLPDNSIGGVILLCHDSLIRVDNTLDSRVKQQMEANMPMLRNNLFPLR